MEMNTKTRKAFCINDQNDVIQGLHVEIELMREAFDVRLKAIEEKLNETPTGRQKGEHLYHFKSKCGKNGRIARDKTCMCQD